MTSAQHVDQLSRLLRDRIPGAVIVVDAPGHPSGDWFIDAKCGQRSFVIELRPGAGFGLSWTPSEGIGEGPDEIFQDEGELVERVARLARGA